MVYNSLLEIGYDTLQKLWNLLKLIYSFRFTDKEEEMDGRDLGRNKTLNNQNSIPECTYIWLYYCKL